MNYKKLLSHIISARLPFDMAEHLGKQVEEGKFRSMPEAVRTYIQAGIRFEKLQNIMKDSKKRAELETNLNDAAEAQFSEQFLETLDFDQLDVIYAKIGLLKDKKIGAVDVRCG